jgi:hypothetical protein
MSTTNRISTLVGIALMAGIGYWGFHSMYAAPKAELEEEISQARSNVAGMTKTLKGEVSLGDRSKALRASTLSGKEDELLHRFRTGMANLGEQCLRKDKVVFDHGQPQTTASPLLSTKGIPTVLKQIIRKTPDIQTVRGTLKGTGSLENVLRVIALAQSQSWIHRVDGFSIKPIGDRSEFELKLDVATLYLPDLPGVDGPLPTIVQPPAELEPMWNAVASKNVFKAPPAPTPGDEPQRPVEVAAAPIAGEAATPPPQVFAPYDDWKLTGVVISGRGAEAFFMNTRTGAKVTVEQGGQVLDAVFVDGQGEHAFIEIAGKRFQLSNGQTLAARKPL